RRLVTTSQEAGVAVDLFDFIDDEVPDPLARTAYHVVQEGLTNIHKHALHTKARVALIGEPGTELVIEVSTVLPKGSTTEHPGAAGRGPRVAALPRDPPLRAGLPMLLGAAPGLGVVAQGDRGAGAVTLVQKHRPDVLLMDVRMPKLDGIGAPRAVSALPNPPKIVMLTTFDMDEYVFQALEAGASGFLLKDTPPQDLARAVHVVAG